jgi:2-polyprenyl-6-methoxyphenol hydroxylase-like FAD-dependent oxidoreductase
LALEDAVVLAKALRDFGDVSPAFAAYEHLRRRRVERIVAQGARSSSSKTPGPLGRLVRDLLLRLMLRLVVTDKVLAWMYEYRVEWERPLVTPRTEAGTLARI